MKYRINSKSLSTFFPFPCDAVDKHIKLATEKQLKVLLVVMRNSSEPISKEKISEFLSIPVAEADDALLYWSQAGILSCDETKKETNEKNPVVKRIEKPSRADVARRGAEDPKIMLLLREAQMKFGRNLKTNEAGTLVWLYEDQGMDISLILLLLGYASSEGKLNIGFIERTAVSWIEQGVETITDAENMIADAAKKQTAWRAVCASFGIENRKPSDRELTLSATWLDDWKISRELLKAAYNRCVDKNAKISFAYIGKILESWHKKGYTTLDDIETESKKAKESRTSEKNGSFAAYDIDKFEEMLNSDD